MFHFTKRIATIAIFVTTTTFSYPVFADNHPKEMLSETWVMTPKAGMERQMESAMQAHLKYRNEMKDPRKWSYYSPVLGDKLDVIAARSFGFGWKDMDSYNQWDKQKDLQKHYAENVEQHVGHYGHYMSLLDMENSHWGPDVEFKYVGVSSYVVKLGHTSAMEEDKKLISDVAKAQNWPYHWAWSNSLSGQGELQLAIPYKNWEAMAAPETKFAEVLAKHLGSEEKAKELFKRWATHFEKITYNIWVRRDDLMK